MSQPNTITASANGTSSTIQVKRPSFKSLWEPYKFVDQRVTAKEVYKIIGGNVWEQYLEGKSNNNPYFENSCALRLSYAFNKGVFTIPSKVNIFPNPKDIQRWRGGDNKAYIFRVNDMIRWVQKEFGNPDIEIDTYGKDVSNQLAGKKGIIIFTVKGWSNATGHVTLWDGSTCGDHCYFTHANSTAITIKVQLWELK